MTCLFGYAIATNIDTTSFDKTLAHDIEAQHHLFGGSNSNNAFPSIGGAQLRKPKKRTSLEDMVEALGVMQESYFELWTGMWPTAIDWTSAVMSTYLSAALITLSSALDYSISSDKPVSAEALSHENLVNRYFMQLVSFYFGQDAFALRTQAYDDMLWVVLGWLEGIKFIHIHSDLHYSEYHITDESEDRKAWHGKQWIPSFAHRARIFWDLAAQGWDTSLCGGGMLWSPYTSPYKNAITNELFIAASISMYLHFPGDSNSSPFITGAPKEPVGVRDPKYLKAAIEGYKWLVTSNMTDSKGLYVDGFHISGWEAHPNGTLRNTQCDEKNDMVYTYNQGVILTGQRGLYEATAARSYLEDGHRLIRNIINATGYDLKHDRVYKGQEYSHRNQTRPLLPQWQGIGRGGVLEESCDAGGYCSQDGQTFKGIFFHHLASFCEPLPPHLFVPGTAFNVNDFEGMKSWHRQGCGTYGGWIRHNAKFALKTKDSDGKFGMWWGAGELPSRRPSAVSADAPRKGVDYRNQGIPQDHVWTGPPLTPMAEHVATGVNIIEIDRRHMMIQKYKVGNGITTNDLNDRGRGRTVETQGGGVSVLRALWEIVDYRRINSES